MTANSSLQVRQHEKVAYDLVNLAMKIRQHVTAIYNSASHLKHRCMTGQLITRTSVSAIKNMAAYEGSTDKAIHHWGGGGGVLH